MLESKLYYESHITIDPVFDEQLKRVSEIAFTFGFKVAELIMRKGGTHKEDSFMTSRHKQYDVMVQRTTYCIRNLQKEGFVVRRYKIEDTMVDSRINDDFKLL